MQKSAKFKSLQKGHLSSESEIMLEETLIDMMSTDKNAFSPELKCDDSQPIYSNKRKKVSAREEENSNSKRLKKFKKLKSNSTLDAALSSNHLMESKQPDVRVEVDDSESKAGVEQGQNKHLLCTSKTHHGN